MAENSDNRTLGELFAELSRETRTLIQQEVQLAKTELTEKVTSLGKGAGMIVAGGLVAYGGLLAIIAGVVLVLIAFGLSPWVAALLGGVVIAAIGYLLVRAGLSALQQADMKPRKTIESLKEDAQWIKTQTR
jgi:uncharacterized membrane protein YqjE